MSTDFYPSGEKRMTSMEIFIANMDLEIETYSNAVRLFFTAQGWPDKEKIKQRFCNEIKAAIERAAEDFKP